MSIALRGSSTATLTAGILLISKSRSFGLPIDVSIVGDPTDVAVVTGPALVHAPVLASCGVGRDLGSGGVVILPGASDEPLAVSLSIDGTDGWFVVDRRGLGEHAVTRAFVDLGRQPQGEGRALMKDLRAAFSAIGLLPEPAVLDFLFGAPASPLDRVALALRAGRAMSGERGQTMSRHLVSGHGLSDSVSGFSRIDDLRRAREAGALDPLFDRFAFPTRDRVEEWFDGMLSLAASDSKAATVLLELTELASHVLALPSPGVLPPLNPAMDAVAVGLGAALGATGPATDGNAKLVEVFKFLGGRFVAEERYPVEVESEPPPSGRLDRWQWFCRSAQDAARAVDDIWRRMADPVQ